VSQESPIRVAIVGGGCASIAAAFELTRPEHAGRYRVTLYQMGWRLGGKGASGRGPAGRIEEHGLHLWMGFYENAFRLMRECYAELARDPERCPIADWSDAFEPDPVCGVMERPGGGRWQPWTTVFPASGGLPGDPLPEAPRWSVVDYLVRSLSLVRTVLETARIRLGREAPSQGPGAAPPPGGVQERIVRLLRVGELVSLAALLEGVSLLEVALRTFAAYPQNLLLQLVEGIGRSARSQLDSMVEGDGEIRRLWEILDLTLAVVRGALRFGLLTHPRGFEAIDDYDCREWLRLNGASERSLDSAFLRALYDLAFAYEDGDPARPRIAAGQALRGALRAFFTYRGAFFWKMKAGMGDVVFAPFYEVLKARGVRFEFFHRLENVGIAEPGGGERPHVEALEFDVQAEVANGVAYRPLVEVRGLPCWPAQPDFSQLVDGARLRDEGRAFESHWDRRKVRSRTLRVGRDFDLVVLGVGLGAIPFVCREILARDARWRTMLERCRTVATQAFQLWLREDMKELGWEGPPVTLSGFVEPFDTWADMRHLIPQEDWTLPPRALAYFCNALPEPPGGPDYADPRYPARRLAEVRANAIRFLDRDVAALWGRALRRPGEFRWELLVDAARAGAPDPSPADASRIDSQFLVANVSPSERYALSLPGSLVHRISPLDPSYDNLTVAGDWTDCGFNEGCVEAAVMSGRLAAHALSLSPALEDIVGFDHP
jgi:uncharacterized protein with NAD-binding domain and iron-sulfur cluster